MKTYHSAGILSIQAILSIALVVHLRPVAIKNMNSEELYHQALIQEIIQLESSGGRYLHGLDGEYGPAQFKEETFNWMKKLSGMDWLEWTEYDDQIVLLDWALRNGYQSHWTTFKKAEVNVVTRRYVSE